MKFIRKLFSGNHTASLLPVVIIAVVSFAVYFNTLSNGFVYDDNAQISENPWIRDIRSVPVIFSQNVWSFREGGTSNYYRPLMHIIYMFTYYLFGLAPWGFHLVNVLFHTANSVLVFLITMRLLAGKLTGGQAGGPGNLPASGSATGYQGWQAGKLSSPPFIAALLFAAHPIHTEAVAWVAGLPDLVYSFFFLLSVYFYTRAEEGYDRFYFLSLIAFFLAAISKEPAMMLPFILIAYDSAFGKGGSIFPGRFLRYIPYAIIGGAYILLRVHALKGFAPNTALEAPAYSGYIINVFPLFAEYLRDLFFPVDLRFWHTFHPVQSVFTLKWMLSLLITAVYAGICVAAWKKDRAAFLGLLLIALPLLPALYIKGIGGKPYAERYLYLSSAGFVMLAAMFLHWLPQRMPRRSFIAAIVALLLAGLYSLQTIRRNPVWENDLILFTDTVKKAPDAALPRRMLGNTLLDMGKVDEAIEQYRIALSLDDNSSTGHANLGLAFMKKGLTGEAIREYQRAVTIDPNDIEAHLGLGKAYAGSGRTDEAIEQY
ncbi:MAG: tetratricopeptide repeat protein, partial [Thermodesulfovibrionales bacterium]